MPGAPNKFGFEQAAMYSAAEVARKLGLSVATVHRAAHTGQLPMVRLAGNTKMLFPRAAIDALCAGAWRPDPVEELPTHVPLERAPR